VRYTSMSRATTRIGGACPVMTNRTMAAATV
jgi:hypothetical protein